MHFTYFLIWQTTEEDGVTEKTWDELTWKLKTLI